MNKPGIWLFWTDTDEFWSNAIRFFTKGYPHMGIGIDLPNGDREYYEALFSEGFTGPHKPSKLKAFVERKNGNKLLVVKLEMDKFNYSIADLFAVQAMCHEWSKKGSTEYRGYGKAQLLSMLLFERFKIPVRHSEKKVVCSEAASRIVERLNIDLRDMINNTHDKVNPASALRKVFALIAGYGDYLMEETLKCPEEWFADYVTE